MNLLKYFLIGSNGIIALMFYMVYFNIPNQLKTVTNQSYTFLVPIYFGFMNIFMILIKRSFQLDDSTAVLLVSLISSLMVFSIAFYKKIYKITGITWIMYYLILFLLHFMAYNLINVINNLIFTP